MRGLKYNLRHTHATILVVASSWMRGLKFRRVQECELMYKRRILMDAWIEIEDDILQCEIVNVASPWMRGLKFTIISGKNVEVLELLDFVKDSLFVF